MKLNDLTKAELEAMSYDDIAYLILSEEKKETKITDLFKKVCDLLGLSQAEYEAKITDFFQVLSTDQRFVMVDKGYWDLKSNHKANIIMDNDDDYTFTWNPYSVDGEFTSFKKNQTSYYSINIEFKNITIDSFDLIISNNDNINLNYHFIKYQ